MGIISNIIFKYFKKYIKIDEKIIPSKLFIVNLSKYTAKFKSDKIEIIKKYSIFGILFYKNVKKLNISKEEYLKINNREKVINEITKIN